jgi:hypothetical protein
MEERPSDMQYSRQGMIIQLGGWGRCEHCLTAKICDLRDHFAGTWIDFFFYDTSSGKVKMDIKEWDGMAWTGLIWLRTETGGGPLANAVMNLRVS